MSESAGQVPAGRMPPELGSELGVEPRRAALCDVMPAVATALGVDLSATRPPSAPLQLPAAERVVVMLVDGLGLHLLERVGGHAPFLNKLRQQSAPGGLSAGFPSTTATSMGSFGTGLSAGTHGLVGYEVLDPGTGRIFNELSWDNAPDPRVWQPNRTVFEEVSDAGVETVHVGPGYFDGSGLTMAALRGPRFLAAKSLTDRVEATIRVVRASSSCLVYLYWGDVDRVGHESGVASNNWLEEVEQVDLAVRTLVRRLPSGTLLVVTADHGMVDVPLTSRWDLADSGPEPTELRRDVVAFGGEPRAPMLYVAPGTAEAVAGRWRDVLAGHADVHLRDEVIRAGWFGPVLPGVRERIGDVLVTMTSDRSVHDSRTQRPQLARLIGLHGSRTAAEMDVPLLVQVT